jgi:hypothetical protein
MPNMVVPVPPSDCPEMASCSDRFNERVCSHAVSVGKCVKATFKKECRKSCGLCCPGAKPY